ncbi:protocadherin Fat 3-like [Littorina saxatilis]|uniref:Cadherin domain-containing protein n=1 Tax=Littorina saxatilis TaxID=31220 RepID=A0AAN9GIS3_9CAEN
MKRPKLLTKILLLTLTFLAADAGRYVSLNTTSDHAHYFINDLGVNVKARTLIFDVTSTADAIIRLAQKQSLSGSYCDVIIGSSSNTGIAVRESCSACRSYIVALGIFLNDTTSTAFWLDWSDGTTLRGGEGSVFGESSLFTYTLQAQFEVNYVTATSYYGNEGRWSFLIDTAPVFTSPNPDGSTIIVISENSPTNTSVITLSASDEEADNVTFAAIGQHASVFMVEDSDVLLKGQLDFETIQWFLVTVYATDVRHNTTATFTVRVSDVNDETPVLTSGSVTSLREELPVGTVVTGLFAVEDKDQGDSFTFYLQGNHSSYFAVNDTSGEVTVARRIDREEGLSTLDDLWVVVTDSANYSDMLKLALKVDDINDNRPQFESDVYSMNVSTSTTADVPILTFNVTDADEGYNSDVKLTLLTSEAGFTMSGTGLYVNTSKLDFNRISSYALTVEASDAPTEGVKLTSVAVVYVQVIHSNDYAPIWVYPIPDLAGFMPNVPVREDIASGTLILSLTARDDDIGTYGNVIYTMTSAVTDNGSNATHLFFLHPTSGDLQTSGTLDRDPNTGGTTFYLLTLKVLDAGSRSSEANLNVTMTDINDNTPTFDQIIYQAYFSCNSPVGATVVSLTARDNDVSSALTYSFVSGGSDYFSLDDATGDITLKTNVTTVAVVSSVHVLTVSVSDGGVSELTSTTAVVVQIDGQCSVGSNKTDAEDLKLTNRILTIACGVLGAGFLLSTILLVVAKVSPKTPLTKVNHRPTTPFEGNMWVKRQHNPGSTVPSCSSGSQRGSSVDTQTTDCSSVNSLKFI